MDHSFYNSFCNRSRDQGLDKMTAKEFLTLSRVIESFVEDTEKVCGRKSTSFRMGLQGQVSEPWFFFCLVIWLLLQMK